MTNQTISDTQRRLNQELHQSRPDYGSRGGAGHQDIIKAITRYQELGYIQSVLDYGTGKGAFPKNLKQALPDLTVGAYDPAVEEFNNKPSQTFDLVTSFDVLEHVERNSIHAVLSEVYSMSSKIIYLQIDLQPAVKRLSSGRNAHIMLAPPDWWVSQIAGLFPVQGSFPIYHQNGEIQKIALVASKHIKYASLVWSLLQKLHHSPMTIQGGYLGAPTPKQLKKTKDKSSKKNIS